MGVEQPPAITPTQKPTEIVVGVLALQGAFNEHLQLLRKACASVQPSSKSPLYFKFIEVRTPAELAQCEALIIPGGESTTISLVAERSKLLEPLREFVKIQRKPVWGTCAGMILLAEQANRTKKGGQELIGGLDVRVDRNHFGRQVESFEKNVELPFLGPDAEPFHAVFIRAPIVESVLPSTPDLNATVTAPQKSSRGKGDVQVLGRLENPYAPDEDKNVVAVMQGNCFGTSFHPELGTDARIHTWWLEKVAEAVKRKGYGEGQT